MAFLGGWGGEGICWNIIGSQNAICILLAKAFSMYVLGARYPNH